MACVEESISERESRRLEGLNTKVKLDIYKRFGKSVEFNKINIYMVQMMQDVHLYLSLGWVCMVWMKSWVGRNVLCVGISVIM